MVIRTRSPNSLPNIEHDDGSDATYLLTPSQHCQNPSHAHHYSHHQSYRHPVGDTVVDESTGGSVVTVISTTPSIRANDTTPDIILTNSESENGAHIDETLSTATRTLSIQSLAQWHDTTDPSATTLHEPNSNGNEAGTDSIQINSFNYQQLQTCNHYGIWANASLLIYYPIVDKCEHIQCWWMTSKQ